MAIIKPFKGMKYNTSLAGNISQLCCPPYDIINDKQRAEYISTNEYNIIRLEKPTDTDNPYQNANSILKMWKDQGILMYDDEQCIYVYEEEFYSNDVCKSIKGIIARVKLEEFSKGIILPHEFTLSKAKEDRLNLMKATNCNFSQIYALYMDNEHTTLNTINEHTQNQSEFEFTDCDNVTHRLWKITDSQVINKIVNDFTDRKLYIADGHHRYETALNYRNYCIENNISKQGDPQDYQMIYLMDMEHPGLVVYPTHRVIRNIQNFSVDKIIDKCKEYFYITKNTNIDTMENQLTDLYKNGKKAFGFYCGNNEWYLLELKNTDIMSEILPDISIASQQLDVTILHTLILENILGIDKENMANQLNLIYTKVFDEAISMVDSGECQCSFIINPTRVTEIRDVALAGEKMPQKSTYFYPKMITGLVMNDLSID